MRDKKGTIVGHIDIDLFKELGLYRENLLWWQKQNLMYTSTGYGHKIPTPHMIQWCGRWRRIYCSIHSNCGTCYIEQGRDWIVVY